MNEVEGKDMCNIAAYAGNRQAAPILLEMLRRQQDYDGGMSAGIATVHEGKLYWRKVVGSVETLMQETVFAPLQVRATYYPQKTEGLLADACRILPPQKGPNFDAEKRKSRPLPPAEINPEAHYALAHGNLCLSAFDLAKLGVAGMTPGFLTEESLSEMRRIIQPFGDRANNLSQGVGTFILQEPRISPRPIYGHQGMAYGAVHGVFFDPEIKKGLAILTTGASEARCGVLADLNFDLISLFLGEKHG